MEPRAALTRSAGRLGGTEAVTVYMLHDTIDGVCTRELATCAAYGMVRVLDSGAMRGCVGIASWRDLLQRGSQARAISSTHTHTVGWPSCCRNRRDLDDTFRERIGWYDGVC